MNKQVAAIGLALAAIAVATFFRTPEKPEPASAPLKPAIDIEKWQDRQQEEALASQFPLPELTAPVFGSLCAGRFRVLVPGEEAERAEAFSIQISDDQEEGIVDGLWPSRQFMAELEPPFWSVERKESSPEVVVEGLGVTEATSLTTRITINRDTNEYEIFWSVFPVGFRTPVEFWESSGSCESFSPDS